MIGWEYPPHNSGGLGVACQGMTEALAGHNNKIYFTLPYNFDDNVGHMQVLSCYNDQWDNTDHPPFLAYDGTVLIRKKQEKISAATLHSLPQSQLEQKVEEYADIVTKQSNNYTKKVDVIHAHDWMSFPAAVQLKKKTNKPVIAHIHSTEYDRIPNGKGSKYITHAEKKGMVIADQVIAVSNYTKRLLVEKYRINPNKIAVVHNGIAPMKSKAQPGRHHFASKRPVVAFMGRLTMQKGADYFLKLAHKILQKSPQCLFIIAGDGDMYHELLFTTAAKSLSASVLFSGFVRDKQKDMLLDRADVFIMPSLSEPFGLVALEAARHHTPVIVSKNAGVSEVLPSAIAVDFWDIDMMAKNVLELLGNPSYSQKIVQGQLKELNNNSWDNSAKKIQEIYSRLSK